MSTNGERVVGVDVGGTKILVGGVGRDGAVAVRREWPTPVGSQDEFLSGLEAAVAELVSPEVKAIGFGIPSRIDQRAGVVVGSVNVPLAGVAFRQRMEERFGIPVGMDNDANAAAIAEWRVGAGRGYRNIVMLTLGTGVGGGLILEGKPYRGSIGSGAELGHMVVEHDGAPCGCGGRGHLEAYVSGRAADAAARQAFGPAADAHRLVRLAAEGDGRAVEILAGMGRRLGGAFGTLVNIFDPDLIVIGGGFAAAGEFLLGPADEVFRREALTPGRDFVRIVRAELGTAAGMIGAALVGFEALDAARG